MPFAHLYPTTQPAPSVIGAPLHQLQSGSDGHTVPASTAAPPVLLPPEPADWPPLPAEPLPETPPLPASPDVPPPPRASGSVSVLPPQAATSSVSHDHCPVDLGAMLGE